MRTENISLRFKKPVVKLNIKAAAGDMNFFYVFWCVLGRSKRSIIEWQSTLVNELWSHERETKTNTLNKFVNS